MSNIPQLTPESALAYCADGHTNAEAAAYWGVSDRYIRKLKSQARTQAPTPEPEPTPHYATVTASAVARDGQLWKCPICGEMMAPLPGTTGAEWAEQGCYLHQAKAPVMSTEAEQPGGTDVEQPEPEQAQEHEDPTPCLVVPPEQAEQELVVMVPVQPPARRIVVREVQQVGVLAWVNEHPAMWRQMLALLILGILIAAG